jgi:hypothetical protein
VTPLGIDAPRFDPFRPDLAGIESLDLNWDHGVNEEGRDFGAAFVNSIGNTGHRWVAALAIPGLDPVRWPVALVDEGGPAFDVFASSVTTWLPCYVIHISRLYFQAAVARSTHGRPIAWLDEEADRFVADAPALREVLAPFPGDVLTPILELLRRKDSLTAADWPEAELYAVADPGGYVAAYRGGADLDALIREYDFYNRPLLDRFAVAPTAALAREVLQRRARHDGDGTTAVLERAAALLSDVDRGEPVGPLLGEIEDLTEAWFATAERWEAAGFPARALACYENAVHEYGQEEDDWHEPSLARIRALTADDADYQYYLRNFLGQ